MVPHERSTLASFSLNLNRLLQAPLRGRAEPLRLGAGISTKSEQSATASGGLYSLSERTALV